MDAVMRLLGFELSPAQAKELRKTILMRMDDDTLGGTERALLEGCLLELCKHGTVGGVDDGG